MSTEPKNDPRGQWPEIGAKMWIGAGAIGVVVEHHPQAFLVRLHMLTALSDYGTTAWFDPEVLVSMDELRAKT